MRAIEPPTIIVVGPSPDRIGGMAGVVALHLAADLGGRFRLRFFPLTFRVGRSERMVSRSRRHIRQWLALRSAMRRCGAAAIHLHTCSHSTFYHSAMDMIAAKAEGCRVILHIHGAAFDRFYDRAGPLGRTLVRRCLRSADRVVALSSWWRDRFRVMSPRARIEVIENAVVIPTNPPRRRADGPCRFVLLAKMDVWKGIEDALDACARLRARGVAFSLTFAGPPGSAGDAGALREKIDRRGIGDVARYVGPLDRSAVEAVLRDSDCLVQPSHWEGMPLSILEAMAFGLPIIASGVGAVPEVIEQGRHGLLVPPHHPDLFADAMAEMAVDPGRRQGMSQAARALVEGRFSVRRFEKDLMALYDGVLSDARTTRTVTLPRDSIERESLSVGVAVTGVGERVTGIAR